MGAPPETAGRFHLHGGAGGAHQGGDLATDAGFASQAAAIQEDQLT